MDLPVKVPRWVEHAALIGFLGLTLYLAQGMYEKLDALDRQVAEMKGTLDVVRALVEAK